MDTNKKTNHGIPARPKRAGCREPMHLPCAPWSAPAQTSLLVAAAIQPFNSYALDLPKGDGKTPWQDMTLAFVWAVVLVMNSVGLAVTMLQLVRKQGVVGKPPVSRQQPFSASPGLE